MAILADAEQETRRLIELAQSRGIYLRLLGGLALKVHCPSAGLLELKRTYADIDMACGKPGDRNLQKFLPEMGYIPDRTFNTLNGDSRQLYLDEDNQRQLDIFIGDFEMCHKIPLSRRLQSDSLSVPLAELFLTKAQIVKLNYKDLLDMLVLLIDHPIGASDLETINQEIIGGLCARDWGLFTTVSINLQKLRDFLAGNSINLGQPQIELALQRIGDIQQVMDVAPKTIGWKARAAIGKRLPWYEEVEEVHR
jgi:hypothetical protein